ncbi:MAG: hypothetical protein ACM3UP_01400 [Methanocella sp.]
MLVVLNNSPEAVRVSLYSGSPDSLALPPLEGRILFFSAASDLPGLVSRQ